MPPKYSTVSPNFISSANLMCFISKAISDHTEQYQTAPQHFVFWEHWQVRLSSYLFHPFCTVVVCTVSLQRVWYGLRDQSQRLPVWSSLNDPNVLNSSPQYLDSCCIPQKVWDLSPPLIIWMPSRKVSQSLLRLNPGFLISWLAQSHRVMTARQVNFLGS